jgi:hypothetical protein
MTFQRVKLEHLLYAAAFLLALAVRLAAAGQLPLNDAEATLALQAHALAHGQAATLSPQPGYLALTTAAMFVMGSADWVARFWPALVGSCAVLLPLLFRKKLGRFAALLAAFFLALDPAMLAISRQADGRVLAVVFTALAFGLWLNHRSALAGVAMGLACLGGPTVWPGLVALLVALWITAATRSSVPVSEDAGEIVEIQEATRGNWRRAAAFGAGTMALISTWFFTLPEGLGAFGESLPAYFRGWLSFSAETVIPAALLLVTLVVYELFPLILGLWGGLRNLTVRGQLFRDPVDLFLLVWWALSLILTVAYPGRQVMDLAWSTLPLWALAARQIERITHVSLEDWQPALGQMVLASVILGYLSVTLISMTNTTLAGPNEYLLRIGAALAMLIACTFLVAWGWSWRVSWRGVVWGLGVVLGIYWISSGWNVTGLSSHSGADLWFQGPYLQETDLLTKTVQNINEWGPTQTGGQDLLVVDPSSPALRWIWKNSQRVSYSAQPPVDQNPALMITGSDVTPSLQSTYRGEGYVLSETIHWNAMKPADWFRWTVFRTLPAEAVQKNQVILWARTDLFPGGAAEIPGNTNSQNGTGVQ